MKHKDQFYFYVYTSSGSTYEFLRQSLLPYQQIGIKTKCITHKDIVQGNILDDHPENVLALFIPGGRSGQQVRDDLGKTGAEKIKNYTRQGGTYIGKCRGGYLAAEVDYEYEGERKILTSDLVMFNAVAKGQLPLLDPRFPSPRQGWQEANTTSVSFIGENAQPLQANVIYWGGARLIPKPGETVNTIATYDAIKNEDDSPAIAVASKTYGDGIAVFSGVHSEIDPVTLRDSRTALLIDKENIPFRMQLVENLTLTNPNRLGLFHQVISESFKAKNGQRYITMVKNLVLNETYKVA